MSEKPTTIEAGQRWASRYHAWWEIVAPIGSAGMWATRNEKGEASQTAASWLTVSGTFLGWAPGYGPQPPPSSVPAPWKVGQRRRGKTIDPWGKTIEAREYIVSHRCFDEGETRWWVRSMGQPENSQAIERVCESWPSTLLPDVPTEPVAAKQPQTDGTHPLPAYLAPRFSSVEMTDGTRPLSALEVIKSRKQPEPWVPSVDEFDLLPDAGT